MSGQEPLAMTLKGPVFAFADSVLHSMLGDSYDWARDDVRGRCSLQPNVRDEERRRVRDAQ